MDFAHLQNAFICLLTTYTSLQLYCQSLNTVKYLHLQNVIIYIIISFLFAVRVECTPSDMLVHLNLAREFRGRVYATGNPQACFELGSGSAEMTLRIPIGTQCGTVQQVFHKNGLPHYRLQTPFCLTHSNIINLFILIITQNRGRYVNHVVIQENPVIMQDTDKTVRVECAFTAEDQTVSFRPTGSGDGRLESGGGISVT